MNTDTDDDEKALNSFIISTIFVIFWGGFSVLKREEQYLSRN